MTADELVTVGNVLAPLVGLGLGVWAVWKSITDRARYREQQHRLEHIVRLIRWWEGADQDYRGKGKVPPMEVLAGVRRIAEGGQLSQATEPALFHECGCPIDEPPGHAWIPPSVLRDVLERHESEGAPPLGVEPPGGGTKVSM